MNIPYQRILVDLDSILDTRAGTLKKIAPDKVLDILSDKYNTRSADIFKYVDMSQYHDAYKGRDIETVAMSYATSIPLFLRGIAKELFAQSTQLMQHRGLAIEVNFYPYQLSEEDQADICAALVSWVLIPAEVTAAYHSPESLTPDFLSSNYVGMICYDAIEWLKIHVQSYPAKKIPNFTIYTPALLRETDDPESDIKAAIDELGHPLEAASLIWKPFVRVEYINVDVFSMFNPASVIQTDPQKSDS